MTPTKLSETHVDEVQVTGLAGLINRSRGAIKLTVPQAMKFRAVYLFLEALTTVGGEDFELEAEVEFRMNGVGIHVMPASIAENAGGTTTVQKSRFTAFANVAAGTDEGWLLKLSNLPVGGQTQVALTPQKLIVECDEIWLNILGSREQSASFSSWRAFLACRSSEVAL